MSASARHFRQDKRTHARPPQRGRWRRRLRSALLWTVILVMAAYVGLQTPPAKVLLTTYLNRSLSSAGRSIQIEGLGGWLPQQPHIEALTLYDERGPWLRMEGLRLAWQPGSWFAGNLVIDRFSAERLQILRRPATAPDTSPGKPPPNLPGVTVEHLRIVRVQLEAPLLGHPYEIGLDGTCRLAPQLAASQGTIDLSGDLSTQIQWQLQTEVTPASGTLAIKLDTPQGQSAAQCHYHVDQGQLALTDVNLAVPGAHMYGDMAVNLSSGLAQGTLQLQAQDTGPVASWFGQTVAGRLQAQAQLEIENNTQRMACTWDLSQAAWSSLALGTASGSLDLQDIFGALNGHLALSVQDFTRGQQHIDQLVVDLRGTPRNGRMSLQTAGTVIQPLTLDTQAAWQAAATGWTVMLGASQGSIDSHRFELQPGAELHFSRNTGTFRDLNLTLDQTALRLAGSLHVEPTEPRVTGDMRIEGDVTADVTWDATVPLRRPEGRAEIVVTRHNIPLTGTVHYTWSPEAFFVSEARLATTGCYLSAQAQRTWDTGMIQGHLQGEIPDACAVTTFLGYPLSARATTQLDFNVDQGTQRVQGNWTVTDVNGLGLRIATLQGDMDLYNLWIAPAGRISAQGTGLAWKRMQWNQWTLQAEGDRQTLDLAMLGAGALDRPLAVDARVTAHLDGSEQALVLQQALVQYGSETYFLPRPAVVRREYREPNTPPRYALDDWQWQTNGTPLTLTGWVSRDRLALQTTVTDLAIDKLPLPSASALSGRVNGTLQIQGSPQSPCIEVTAKTQALGLQASGADDVTALDGTLTARLTPNDLTANVTLTTPTGDRVQADVDVPVEFSLWPPRWTRPVPDLYAHVTANTDVGILDWLPVLREAVIEGRIVADLTYQGPPEAGTIQGRAQWIDGRYEDILLGTVVQNIQAQLHGQGDTLILDKVVATDGNQGRLVTQGRIRMAPGLPYHIDVQAERFPWVQRADVTTVTSGQVTLAGTLRSLTLDGQLTLDYGLLDVDALPPVPPPVLTPSRTVTTAVMPSPPETLTVQGNLNLDLRGGFRIYGAGLDSIWDGRLNLARTDDHWNVTGVVSPRRGEFRLLGRPFRLTEGSIRLDGSWPIVPILDLTAVYRRSGIEARMRISGRADQPIVRIESDPPLPEDAILATVLFGRDLATITAMQALQLAVAVKNLHSPGGGVDVFQRTRQAVGVDTLEFRQADDQSGSASVAVGKYLAPEVYVEVQQPISSGGTTSTHIEYEIRPNLTLETDAGPGIRPGIGVNWKKDY